MPRSAASPTDLVSRVELHYPLMMFLSPPNLPGSLVYGGLALLLVTISSLITWRLATVRGKKAPGPRRSAESARSEANEQRYQSLFEEASIPLFEEDFSAVKALLSPLAASGALNEALLLADDRALARECAARARIVAINAEARLFFTNADGTTDPAAEPGSSIGPNFSDEGWRGFARELLALVGGAIPFQTELTLVLPNGEERIITIRVTVPLQDRSSLSRVFVSFLDVTPQKRGESALRKSLRENEALIRELRHRTMNNMQVISSMLRIEEDRAPDERCAAAFRSLDERIEAMSMVHEILSSGGEFSRIGVASYASDLVGMFMRNGGLAAGRVAACVEAGDISLPFDMAVPFGLALGELISNAFRHAFTAKDSGRLWIRLKAEGVDVRLEVEDDGIGLPAGFDYRRQGRLGIQNVILLVEGQLHGEVSVESGNSGPRWRARFPLANYVERL
jgi:two-component sensor histidine kinase